jgi:hypothetical protein
MGAVDGDFDDAVDPESDISGDDSGMETNEDDNVHVGGNGNDPLVCVPIDEHYEMPYQPGNVVQDPAPMNRPNINATLENVIGSCHLYSSMILLLVSSVDPLPSLHQ